MLLKLSLSIVWIKVFNGGLLELSLSTMIAQLGLMFIGIYVLMLKK